MTSKINLTLIVVLGSLTAFAPLSIDMYLSSMPTLERFFGASSHIIQLTLASFFIGFSLGQAFYGPLSDRYGRKLPLYIGLGLFVISSIGCALSTTVSWLIFFRFLQAAGACSGGVIARAIVRDLFHPNDASRIYSYLMLVSGLAPMLAPVVGGYILTAFGWKAIFLTLAALGSCSLIAVKVLLADSHAERLCAPLSIRDVLLEYAHLLGHRHLMGYALMSGFTMAGMFAYITSSPFVFIDIYNLSVERYGILFGLNAATFVVAAQINARVVKRIEAKVLIVVPIIMLALFGTIMFVDTVFGIGGFFGVVMPLLGFMLCIGFIVPNATALAMAPFGHNAGSASALLGTIQFSMAAIASITLGAMQEAAMLSMGTVMMCCGVSAVFVYFRLVR
jgi:MFS transporter, DHA1 family, multidrug resistance protein